MDRDGAEHPLLDLVQITGTLQRLALGGPEAKEKGLTDPRQRPQVYLGTLELEEEAAPSRSAAEPAATAPPPWGRRRGGSRAQKQQVVLKKVKARVEDAEEIGRCEHLLNVYVDRQARGACASFKGFFEVAPGEARGKITAGKWLVWEYEGVRTLSYFLRRRDCTRALAKALSVAEASVVATVMEQLLQNVQKVHAIGIVHRDLKPANIIFSEASDTFKLIDLGAAADLRLGTNFCPTESLLDPLYCAPEQYVLPTDAPDLANQAGVVSQAISPLLWARFMPDRFDMYSAGLIMAQLAVPALRSESALRGFTRSLRRADYDLEKWRRRSGRQFSSAQTAALDADGGAGWELLGALLRPRKHSDATQLLSASRRRPSAQEALRHRFMDQANQMAAVAEPEQQGGLFARIFDLEARVQLQSEAAEKQTSKVRALTSKVGRRGATDTERRELADAEAVLGMMEASLDDLKGEFTEAAAEVKEVLPKQRAREALAAERRERAGADEGSRKGSALDLLTVGLKFTGLAARVVGDVAGEMREIAVETIDDIDKEQVKEQVSGAIAAVSEMVDTGLAEGRGAEAAPSPGDAPVARAAEEEAAAAAVLSSSTKEIVGENIQGGDEAEAYVILDEEDLADLSDEQLLVGTKKVQAKLSTMTISMQQNERKQRGLLDMFKAFLKPGPKEKKQPARAAAVEVDEAAAPAAPTAAEGPEEAVASHPIEVREEGEDAEAADAGADIDAGRKEEEEALALAPDAEAREAELAELKEQQRRMQEEYEIMEERLRAMEARLAKAKAEGEAPAAAAAAPLPAAEPEDAAPLPAVDMLEECGALEPVPSVTEGDGEVVEAEEAAAVFAEGGAGDAGEEGGEDEAEQEEEEEVSAALDDDDDDPWELAEAGAEEEETEAGALAELELSDAQAFMQNINAELAGITEGLPADPAEEVDHSGAVVHEEDDGSLIFSFEPEEEEANSLGR